MHLEIENIHHPQIKNMNLSVYDVGYRAAHLHPEIELILVLKGDPAFNINGNTTSFSEKDIILINANELHEIISEKAPSTLLSLHILPQYFEGYFPQMSHISFLENTLLSKNERLFTYSFCKLLKIYLLQAPYYQLECAGLINIMVHDILQSCAYYEMYGDKLALTTKRNSQLSEIIGYIEEHSAERVTLSDLAKYTKQIKEAVSIPISSVGRIVTPENAEALIENGVCDIVGLGRSLLADPDYVKKLEAGEGRRIRHCMMCNKGCTDAIQNRKFLSCVLNAENGYEYERTITPSDEKKKVVVIGGGVAGMEAARVASVKGHEVVLFEKETTLGGQLNIASVPPRKSEMNRALRYLTNEMKELHVDLRLGRTADAEMILAENPDNVIVAAGAHNVIPPIEGSKMPHVFDAWKVLNHEELPSGRVVVIGGGLVGAETAELLAEMGCQVSVVEMMEEIAKEESKTVRPVLFESFEKYQVQLLTGTKVTAITANSVEAENAEGKVSLPCDYVVLAVGARPNSFDAQALEDKGVQVSFVGDCNERAADINRAVEEGYLAANVL